MRPLVLIALVGFVSGCHTLDPRPPRGGFPSMLVGAPIDERVSAEPSCREPGLLDGKGTVVVCEPAPHLTAKVTCNLKCRTEHDPDDPSHVTITPLEPGLFEYELSTVHGRYEQDAGGGRYQVYLPERIELWCGAKVGARADPSFWRCTEDGVPAAFPLVQPRLYGKGANGARAVVTVNGRRVAMHADVDWFSLADVFPRRRVTGGGVTPGRYELELAVGAMTERVVVTVR